MVSGSAIAAPQAGDAWGGGGVEAPSASAPSPVGGDEAFIVGGTTVQGEAYQSVVYLEMLGGTAPEGSCTGSLIHPNWILTAAHCTDGDDITSITVSFGNAQGQFTRTVSGTKGGTHPDWIGTLNATLQGDFEGDVALIKLSEPVYDVTPMSLNAQPMNADWIDDPVTFIGFGITEGGGGGGGTKRLAEVSITNTFSYRFENGFAGQGTCQGDSGGPGVKISGNSYTQVGITSYGAEGCRGTSSAMRVDAYLPWIRETMAPDVPQTGFAADPTFRCSNEVSPGDATTVALGETPFELKCVVDFYLADKITRTRWFWGDTTTDEFTSGEELLKTSHTYTEAGSFNVKLCVDYDRPAEGGGFESASSCVLRKGYALACAEPTPAFAVRPVDTNTLAFDNLTSLETDRCIYNIAWQVFEGESATGTPLATIESWQPVYKFPDAGKYTVVLNIGGIGGTGASAITVDVGAVTRGVACGTLGPDGVGLFAAAGLLLIRRRRR